MCDEFEPNPKLLLKQATTDTQIYIDISYSNSEKRKPLNQQTTLHSKFVIGFVIIFFL